MNQKNDFYDEVMKEGSPFNEFKSYILSKSIPADKKSWDKFFEIADGLIKVSKDFDDIDVKFQDGIIDGEFKEKLNKHALFSVAEKYLSGDSQKKNYEHFWKTILQGNYTTLESYVPIITPGQVRKGVKEIEKKKGPPPELKPRTYETPPPLRPLPPLKRIEEVVRETKEKSASDLVNKTGEEANEILKEKNGKKLKVKKIVNNRVLGNVFINLSQPQKIEFIEGGDVYVRVRKFLKRGIIKIWDDPLESLMLLSIKSGVDVRFHINTKFHLSKTTWEFYIWQFGEGKHSCFFERLFYELFNEECLETDGLFQRTIEVVKDGVKTRNKQYQYTEKQIVEIIEVPTIMKLACLFILLIKGNSIAPGKFNLKDFQPTEEGVEKLFKQFETEDLRFVNVENAEDRFVSVLEQTLQREGRIDESTSIWLRQMGYDPEAFRQGQEVIFNEYNEYFLPRPIPVATPTVPFTPVPAVVAVEEEENDLPDLDIPASRVQDIIDENKRLKSENQLKDQENQRLNKETDEIKKEKDEIKKRGMTDSWRKLTDPVFKTTLEKNEIEIKELNTKLEEKQRENDQLQKTIDDKNDEILQLQFSNLGPNDAIDQLKNDIVNLQRQRDEYKNAINGIKDEINKLKASHAQEIDNLKKENTEYKSVAEILLQEKTVVENENKQLKDELKQKNEDDELITPTINEMRDWNNNLEKTNKNLQKLLEEAQVRLNEIDKKLQEQTNLRGTVEELTQQKEKTLTEINELKEKISKEQEEYRKLQALTLAASSSVAVILKKYKEAQEQELKDAEFNQLILEADEELRKNKEDITRLEGKTPSSLSAHSQKMIEELNEVDRDLGLEGQETANEYDRLKKEEPSSHPKHHHDFALVEQMVEKEKFFTMYNEWVRQGKKDYYYNLEGRWEKLSYLIETEKEVMERNKHDKKVYLPRRKILRELLRSVIDGHPSPLLHEKIPPESST
jgi:hypothetical protein